ncbi:MAG: hypothetical protein GJ680_07740 [Alteromonadaceae bacterium]|nr:hypothetical protein [Alteromonadaceae bacterium]
MMSEVGVTRLAIKWYVLALKTKAEQADKAQLLFAKASAFMYVLRLSDKRKQSLKDYAENLLQAWKDNQSEQRTALIEWLDNNINPNF